MTKLFKHIENNDTTYQFTIKTASLSKNVRAKVLYLLDLLQLNMKSSTFNQTLVSICLLAYVISY